MTASSHPQRRFTSLAQKASACLASTLLCLVASPLGAQANDSSARIAADATRLLTNGRAYQATRLLLSRVATPPGRDPELLLLAARAAAGWSGWGTVVRLLANETWLDRPPAGSGRALLARARVEQSQEAVTDARAAVATAPEADLGPRVVTLARAFDRAGLLDSAAAAYRRAAALLPTIADWLLLRAAGVTADSSHRASLYREVSLPAAVPRIRWTEALALDRTGNPPGAARAYEALGATVTALQLRLNAAADSSLRAALRSAILAVLTPARSADDTRTAIEILDRAFSPLTRAEERTIARRAAAAGLSARSATGFARAPPLTDADRLVWGTVLARLGRHRGRAEGHADRRHIRQNAKPHAHREQQHHVRDTQ